MILHNDAMVTNPAEVDKDLADNCTVQDLTSLFTNRRCYSESCDINFTTGGEAYNVPFSIYELRMAIKYCHGSSPGHDNIP